MVNKKAPQKLKFLQDESLAPPSPLLEEEATPLLHQHGVKVYPLKASLVEILENRLRCHLNHISLHPPISEVCACLLQKLRTLDLSFLEKSPFSIEKNLLKLIDSYQELYVIISELLEQISLQLFGFLAKEGDAQKKFIILNENIIKKTIDLNYHLRHNFSFYYLQFKEQIGLSEKFTTLENCFILLNESLDYLKKQESLNFNINNAGIFEIENFYYIRSLVIGLEKLGENIGSSESLAKEIYIYCADNNLLCKDLLDEEIMKIDPSLKRENIAKSRQFLRLNDKNYPLSVNAKEGFLQALIGFTQD